MQQFSTQVCEQVSNPPGFADRAAVESALNEWRRHALKWLSDELHQAGVERTLAADGLAIAHRNPGVMDEDVISMLWDDLESSSVRQARLDRVITAIEEMEFPALLVRSREQLN